jgi:hypothetical protein
MEGLKSQGVSDAYQIQAMREGEKKPTGTVILTFHGSTLPDFINVGYLRVHVRVYIPNPRRCFNCQKYGHYSDHCKNDSVCERCGKNTEKQPHNPAWCQSDPHCVNCSGNHKASAKECPKWKEEKEIQKLKCTMDITITEARKMLEAKLHPNIQTTTYAETVRGKPQMATISVQTDLTWVSKLATVTPTVTSSKTSVGTQSVQQEEEVSLEQPVNQIPQSMDKDQPVNQTPQSTGKDERPVIAPKPPRINRNSGRSAKGLEDPAVQYNKYGVLDSPEAMQTDNVPPNKQTKKNDTGAKDKSIGKTKHHRQNGKGSP